MLTNVNKSGNSIFKITGTWTIPVKESCLNGSNEKFYIKENIYYGLFRD